MKTAELTGAALDWAVAKCEGRDLYNVYGHIQMEFCPRYSTDWAQGGPIIEREEMGATVVSAGGDEKWLGANYRGTFVEYGTTCLEACMRCYVASKLGDEVEIPAELM